MEKRHNMNNLSDTDIENNLKRYGINLNNLGLWPIGPRLFFYLISSVPPGQTILEIGAGTGTIELSKLYKVYSIESNHEYIGLSKTATYIYAPLKDGWYDMDIVSKQLSDINYSAIIVDGPNRQEGNRQGFLDNLQLFDTNGYIFFDDINSESIFNIYNNLSNKLQRKTEEYWDGEKKFGVIHCGRAGGNNQKRV